MLELRKLNHSAVTISEAMGISKEDWDKAYKIANESEQKSSSTSEFVEHLVTSIENDDQLVAVIVIMHANLHNERRAPDLMSMLREKISERGIDPGDVDCEGCPSADGCPDYKPKE